jgi:hypothetical protein
MIKTKQKNEIFLAILTRNQSSYLKHYLKCIEELDYDKKDITIHVSTNNNDDDTEKVLNDWVNANTNQYKYIIFDRDTYQDLSKDMGWEANNGYRLKVMGKVRQKSIDTCKKTNCGYYFVCDTDNWIESCTLKYMVSKRKPIIAPYLIDFAKRNTYANYFPKIDENGYFLPYREYEYALWSMEKQGTFEVPVVHCTYMVDTDYLDDLTYISKKPFEYEFVTFSNCAREKGIPQFICNERLFGYVRYDTIVDLASAHEIMKKECENENGIKKNPSA